MGYIAGMPTDAHMSRAGAVLQQRRGGEERVVCSMGCARCYRAVTGMPDDIWVCNASE